MHYTFTGGDRGVVVPLFFDTMEPLPYYYLFMALAVAMVFLIFIIMKSRIGYYLKAIRNDELAARSMGVNIVLFKVFAFMVASGIAGIAGTFYAHSFGLVSPVLGEFTEMAMIIIFVVIGGIRTMTGPIIGALSIRILMEVLREWSEIRIVILCTIVILTMRLCNGGLIELFRRSKLWIKQMRPA
jgi:branched-chain amino acid transport system permease protein